jgi:L-alanine-DL-glutamate epimerase-like enolase superfamily enzyme
MADALARFGLEWLEEPMPADTPVAVWRKLAQASPVPLAGGENLRSRGAFDEILAERPFAVLQPDPIKWGGFSGTLPVGREAVAAGLRFCPHYLGGGIGLMACAQLLAALDAGSGFLEFDTNANPLREHMVEDFPVVTEGGVALPRGPGLGVEPDLRRVAGFLVSGT